MENWKAPPHQKKLAGLGVRSFGYDNTNQILYKFNQFGFRSYDITKDPSVIAIGNSISFGVGVDQSQTFACQAAAQLNLACMNLSYGCWLHENQDHLNNIELVSQRDCEDIIIIQINNLDRKRINSELVVEGNDDSWCVTHFCKWFDQCHELLKSKNKIWLYWDNKEYSIPNTIKKQIAIHNKLHLDQSLPNVPSTFGLKSHSAVAKLIVTMQKFRKVVQE